MSLSWKPNWEETKQRFIDWWAGDGLVMCPWGAPPAAIPHEEVENPGRFLQIWLLPAEKGIEPGYEQKAIADGE